MRIADQEACLAWLATHDDGERYEAVVRIEQSVIHAELKKITEIRSMDLPFCGACGSTLQEDGRHEDEPLFEYDHEALPAKGYAVVLAGTEEQVDGAEATVPPPTATVKVHR